MITECGPIHRMWDAMSQGQLVHLMLLTLCSTKTPGIPALLQPDMLHEQHCAVLLLPEHLFCCHIDSPLLKGLACCSVAEAHHSAQQHMLHMLAAPDIY